MLLKKSMLNTNRIIESVVASLSFEGLKPSEQAQMLGKQYLEDKISSTEAVTRIKAMHATSFER